MATRVGIFVQQCVTGAVPRDNVICFIVTRLRDACEQTLIQRGLGREDIFDTPRSVEWIHKSRVAAESTKVKGSTSLRGFAERFEPAAQDVDEGFYRQFYK